MVKVQPSGQKLRGGYYTPPPIADFLAQWAIRTTTATILEPSCGDGAVLAAATARLLTLGASPADMGQQIQATELNDDEAQLAINRLSTQGVPLATQIVHVADFFSYCQDHFLAEEFLGVALTPGYRFDAIVGNPPFIRYQSFPEAHQRIAFELMRRFGLHPNRLTNAWVPFLVVCAHLLTDAGRLAFVIPAELFQVSYAAEVRQFLSEYFQCLTIVTFKDLVFADIQQEVILLLAEKQSPNKGIRVVELDGIAEGITLQPEKINMRKTKPLDHNHDKWTQYFLALREIELLRELRTHPRVCYTGDVMEVDVGVVTGQNDVFLLSDEQVQEHEIPSEYLTPIVSRSAHLEGLLFKDADWQYNLQRHLPVFILQIPKVPLANLPASLQAYVQQAERNGLHLGYKCRTRTPWFTVPSTWVPDAFMLRQVHGHTKLSLNRAGATCTDTIHRVRIKPGFHSESVAMSMLTSMTFAYAEITGRSYGGGVLTFEPSEAERLPIAVSGAETFDAVEMDEMLRHQGIQAILTYTDRIVLRQNLGLSQRDITTLRGIWEKMRDRRINRK